MRWTIFAALVLLTACKSKDDDAKPGQPVESLFDADAGGWMVVEDPDGEEFFEPTWMPEEGGYVSADDKSRTSVWYWSAPDPFLGKKGGYVGTWVNFDLRIDNVDLGFDQADLILIGDGLELHWEGPYRPGTEWTTYEVLLSSKDPTWRTSKGGLVTNAKFERVLGNLDQMLIRGEYHSGDDTGDLDNVIFGIVE